MTTTTKGFTDAELLAELDRLKADDLRLRRPHDADVLNEAHDRLLFDDLDSLTNAFASHTDKAVVRAAQRQLVDDRASGRAVSIVALAAVTAARRRGLNVPDPTSDLRFEMDGEAFDKAAGDAFHMGTHELIQHLDGAVDPDDPSTLGYLAEAERRGLRTLLPDRFK